MTMADAKQGAYPFNTDLQMLANAARPKLDKIYPRASQGIQLCGSPYVTLKAVSEDDIEDCDELEESVSNLRSELEALVLKINPPANVFPSTPGNHIGAQIDCSNKDLLSQDQVTTAQKMSHNIGKVHLLAMGYCPTDGPRLLPMTEAMTDIFTLGMKEMAESFNNIVHSQSQAQANSLDAVNRQTADPAWRSTP